MELKHTEIFSQRLKQARLMKGLSMEELTQSMSGLVSKQAISKYEKGRMMPDSSVLIALANALEMKIDYFFRPFTVEVEKVEFRKKSGFTEKMSKAVKERVREELERYLEIEQTVGIQSSFTLPHKEVSTLEEVKRFAREIRNLLSLGTDGISNVIEVLEENGVKVIELAEDKEFDGLSGFANKSIPLIVVNANFPTERKRYTALHELGHLLLDIPSHITSKEVETLCNAFASEMLLPEVVIKAKLGHSRHDISLSELIDIQRQFGISIDDIMGALQELGVISGNRYAVFQKKKNSMAGFRALVEESRSGIEKSGRFARMIYRALADELISSSKAAMLLNTSIDKVNTNLQLI